MSAGGGGAARRAGLNLLLRFGNRRAADEAATAATPWVRWAGDDGRRDDDRHRRPRPPPGHQSAPRPWIVSATDESAPSFALLTPATTTTTTTRRPPSTLGSLFLLAEKQHHHHHLDRRAVATSAAPQEQQQQPSPPSQHSLTDVQGLLDSLSALRLREELAAASGATPYVPHARLIEMVRDAGAADTAAEAEKLADALVRSGVVLRLGGVVYLRPHEVAEMVLSVMPSDGSAAALRLGEIERDLEGLDRAHAEIVAQARRWPRFWLGAGCAAFAAQLAGFIYLCYWELSWDVVEPLACFVSMGWTLVAWLYFLARGSALDYGAFDSHWTQTGLEKRMAARGFDPERHEQLAMARDRYRRYLHAQRAAALAEGVPAGGPVSRASAGAAGMVAGVAPGGE